MAGLRHFWTRAIAILGSMRLGAVLLLLLIAAAIIGGVIPQSPMTPNAADLYASYGPLWERLILRFGLDDVFHSPSFLTLVGLFALNLFVCTSHRIRRTTIRAFGPSRFVPITKETAIRVPVGAPSERRMALAMAALRRLGLRPAEPIRDAESGRTQIVAGRFRFGVLGADLSHIGILVILVGAMLGVLREEGTIHVNEWQTGLRLPPCHEGRDEGCIPSRYAVQVDDFGIERDETTGQTTTYWADLSFWQNGERVETGRTAVNRPLKVAGIGYYPWRYGTDPSAARVRLHVVDSARDLIVSQVELEVGEQARVPSIGWTIAALRYFRTFAVDDQGHAVDLGGATEGHAAVLLEIRPGEEEAPYRDLALPFLPETSTRPAYVFLLSEAIVPSRLTLHFVRSPGYPVVWIGFVIVMTGLGTALYFGPTAVRLEVGDRCYLLRAESRRARSRLEGIAERIRLDCVERGGAERREGDA